MITFFITLAALLVPLALAVWILLRSIEISAPDNVLHDSDPARFKYDVPDNPFDY